MTKMPGLNSNSCASNLSFLFAQSSISNILFIQVRPTHETWFAIESKWIELNWKSIFERSIDSVSPTKRSYWLGDQIGQNALGIRKTKRSRTKSIFVCESLNRFISILDCSICVSFYFNFFNVELCTIPYPHCAHNKSCKYVYVCCALYCSVAFEHSQSALKSRRFCLAYTAYGTREIVSEYLNMITAPSDQQFQFQIEWNRRLVSVATTASQSMTHSYCISISILLFFFLLLQFIRVVVCLLNIVDKLI